MLIVHSWIGEIKKYVGIWDWSFFFLVKKGGGQNTVNLNVYKKKGNWKLDNLRKSFVVLLTMIICTSVID